MFPLSVNSFSQIFSSSQIVVYLVVSILNAVVIFMASMKFLLVLQQCNYRAKSYFKWLGNKNTPYKARLMLLCLLAFLFFCVLNMCFASLMGETFASFLGFVSYLLFSFVYYKTEQHVNAKIPLKKTRRLIRLCITYMLLLAIFTFGVMVLVDYLSFVIGEYVVAILRYSIICLMPMLIPYVLFLAFGINEPIERASRKRYLKIAVEKLEKSSVIRIGITGSYAKTSVKEILKTILAQKYRVLASPASFNTPLGIALTVENLDSTHDIFIAEMGARASGEIKELTDMVKPDYAIITGINNQHLETFGTIENIKNTKYELVENMKEGGVAFFASDNEGARELMDRFNGEKYSAGLFGEDNLVTATDVKTNAKGVTFTLNIKGEKPVKCTTTLLGSHSVKNILLASAVAYKIGLTPKEIVVGINRIQSIGHRLELLPNNKNIIIIDDSYNSSVDGVKAAMDVLDTFKGRKIVVTPGLVELGKMQSIANFEMGKTLAKHADLVIVIGKHNAVMLINGMIDEGMEREHIKFAKNLNKGNQMLNEIIKEGDVVLFENDLPDNYN